MTMATETKPVELSRNELEELGIGVPSQFVEAYRIDDDTITVLVYDEDGGSMLDAPNEDHSGGDAWEWIAFDNGRERDEWLEDNELDPVTDVLIERYEHSLVRYAPVYESSQVDRQWDVAIGVAVIRFTKPDEFSPAETDRRKALLDVARGICEEYTSWCNGDAYGILRYSRRPPIDAPHSPVLIPDEFTEETWEEIDSCWGFLGFEYAREAAKGDY